MLFRSPTVARYIFSGAKTVATIRRSGYYKVGQAVVLNVGGKKLRGRVITVEKVSDEALSRYVEFSGFSDVKEWLVEAERLHRRKITPDEFEIVVVKIK